MQVRFLPGAPASANSSDRGVSLFKATKYDIIRVMKKFPNLILGAILSVSFASPANASLSIFSLPSVPPSESSPDYCKKESHVGDAQSEALRKSKCDAQKKMQKQREDVQKEAGLQQERDNSCQNYVNTRSGGHGVSVFDPKSGLCKTTCDTGYRLSGSNLCILNSTSTNQSAQQVKSGLTEPQIQAIALLLEVFGADKAIVTKVEAALRGN